MSKEHCAWCKKEIPDDEWLVFGNLCFDCGDKYVAHIDEQIEEDAKKIKTDADESR